MREEARERFARCRCGIWLRPKPAFLRGEAEENARALDWQWSLRRIDAQKLAEDIAATGARYVFISLSEEGLFFAPSGTVDEAYRAEVARRCKDPMLERVRPAAYFERSPRRDLLSELIPLLKARGILLGLSVSAKSPSPRRMPSAVWLSALSEWSERYGREIFAYLVTDCGARADFEALACALRRGNPEALLSFDTGAPNASKREYLPSAAGGSLGDFTAGRTECVWPVPISSQFVDFSLWNSEINGQLLHVLSFLGESWGLHSEPRINGWLAGGATKLINSYGGVVTWEVPIFKNGRLPEPYVSLLSQIAAIAEGRASL